MSDKQPIKSGDAAADFTLKDNRNNDVRLADLKGRKVLLSFHPLAWTDVCAKQMQALEDNKQVFASLNTVAFGISVDPVPTKNAWAKKLGVKETKLLSDFWPHGAIAKKYGVFRDTEGFSERANIIINEDQSLLCVKVYDIPQLPDINEIIALLAG